MKRGDEFDISIFNLKKGVHHYQFNVEQQFFEGQDMVKSADAHVDVRLEKSFDHINLEFDIKGTVELECDRTLKKFDQPITAIREIKYKFGDEDQELNDDIMIISRDRQKINIRQELYDFIMLEVPAKKIHPDERSKEEVFWTFKDENSDDDMDPRWSALKNIKNNN